MGTILYIKSANFSTNAIGSSTPPTSIPVTALSITGGSSYSGYQNQFDCIYTPTNTTQIGVNWSITSGSQYATIDSQGVMTILSGADNSAVTVKVTSTANSSVYATKNITVTYVKALTGLTIIGESSYTTNSFQLGVTYAPTDTTQTGVVWSITSGGTYATINSSTGAVTVLEGANASSITVRATSSANSSITATKTITVTHVADDVPLTALAISGDSTVTDTANYTVTYTPSTTTQTGVTWSVVSGSEYATINSATGVVTALDGASSSSVTIRATSSINSSIYIDKTITVTKSAAASGMTWYFNNCADGKGTSANSVSYFTTPKDDSVTGVPINTIYFCGNSAKPTDEDNKVVTLKVCSNTSGNDLTDVSTIGTSIVTKVTDTPAGWWASMPLYSITFNTTTLAENQVIKIEAPEDGTINLPTKTAAPSVPFNADAPNTYVKGTFFKKPTANPSSWTNWAAMGVGYAS